MEFNRRDAKTPRYRERRARVFILLFFALCLCVSAVNLSCSTKPTHLRTLVPAETLVYLETDDLAAALQPIVDSKPFNDVAKRKPDFSALKGVQLAVAVTGFETTEVELTDEHSVGKVQPRFVAIADTHAWNFQAVGFAEKKLGSFVADIYDSEPKLEQIDKNGGKYFTWTAKDGRKAFALVIDSLIFFGNDESAIEKCLAVRRGESDSIAKTGKLPPRVPGNLANGYVSTDGVAQIANIAGMQFASQASDDSEVQSAVAGILPQLIRGMITEISWSSARTPENMVEDKYSFGASPEVGLTFSETLIPGEKHDTSLLEFVPNDGSPVPAMTLYDLKDPQIAWRSLLLTARGKTDAFGGKLISEFSGLITEPYGIRDPELFLSSVGPSILTANFDRDGEKPVVIGTIRNKENLLRSLSEDLKVNAQPSIESGSEVRRSEDGELAVAIAGDYIIVGDSEAVSNCLNAHASGKTIAASEASVRQFPPNIAASTIGGEQSLAGNIAEMLSERRDESAIAKTTFTTQTRFTKNGMERRTVSDFGFVGWLIAQLAAE